MSKMISVASGFQYSVNIGYDLNNDDKLKNFIPTRSALDLMEEVILSTNTSSNERARVLVGAYGKGKSHIVLSILAILMKRDLELFKKAMPKIKENASLYQCIQNYYESNNKILPVIITGSNTSLSQAFLLALHRTLSMNGLLNAMPETNYRAAVNVIERWKNEFPDTFEKLKKEIDCPINIFIEQLQDYNIETYEQFEKIYPKLTAGSYFNPFIGFDVIDLYEEAVKGIKSQGYTGIYVIYDEFSKYLEANITDASVSDTKMLQDFAEKCNRSGELQLHLMLISHKEIANYIDRLPKQKVDGWRGVSERFKHIHLNNNFSQTYEIVESAIHKKDNLWRKFCEEYVSSFEDVKCNELFKVIIMNDTSKQWSEEDRINICFKYRDKMDENAIPPITEDEIKMMKDALDLFNEYVMGGIELLYENFTSSAKVSIDDTVDYAYKAMFDQRILIESRQSGIDVNQLLRPEY